MPFKKITKKEWIEKGLPELITNIHIGPYYQWDNKKKDFKKPIYVVTQKLVPNKKEVKNG